MSTKTKFFLMLVFLVTNWRSLVAQDRNINKKVFVTTNKTTFLIFNSEIDFYDYGSKEVGVELTDKPNILRLKSTGKGIKETNLTVLTKDEQFYSIIINYKENPDTLNYFFKSTRLLTPKSEEKLNEVNVKSDTQASESNRYEAESDGIIRASKKQTSVTGGRQGDVIVLVKGVYIKGEKLYIHLAYINQSSINFDFDFIKFYIRSKARLKKASIQDYVMEPIYTSNEGKFIKLLAHGKEENNQVFIFDKFTIPKQKEFIIDIGEKNGERNISFELSGSSLLSAKHF